VQSRSVRIGLLLLGLLAAAGAGYRIFLDEQSLSAPRERAAGLDRAAEQALAALADFRAAVHAYVAPGQSTTAWTGRAQQASEMLQQRLTALEAPVAQAGGSLSISIAGLAQLASADARARDYVDNGQDLLAGDIIFTEMRNVLDQSVREISEARDLLARTAGGQATRVRREQAALALIVLVVWLVIAGVLVPTPDVKSQADWRLELAQRLKPAPPVTDELNLHLAPASAAPAALVAPELFTVAAVCSDLSALSDMGALPDALSRACEVLGAQGVIVWIASTDASRISPVASHGYDPKMLARIGSVSRDADNLTSMAFREATPRLRAAGEKSPAALAVPMCGPSGPVGVLSAELQAGRSADQTSIALATIFAAQLATLAMPVPAADSAVVALQKQA
jgi:hypothetical protein